MAVGALVTTKSTTCKKTFFFLPSEDPQVLSINLSLLTNPHLTFFFLDHGKDIEEILDQFIFQHCMTLKKIFSITSEITS